jgi:hypothetical protein
MKLLFTQEKERTIRHYASYRSLGPSFLHWPQLIINYMLSLVVSFIRNVISEGITRALALGFVFLVVLLVPKGTESHAYDGYVKIADVIIEIAVVLCIIHDVHAEALKIAKSFHRSTITYSDRERKDKTKNELPHTIL